MNPKLNLEKNTEITLEYIQKYPSSNKSAWWQCSKDTTHVWETAISNVIKKNSKCPFCLGMRASKTYNLEALYPDIIKEWNFEKNQILPNMYTPFSSKKVWWVCALGHEWDAQISERVKQGTKCRYCSHRAPSKEANLQVCNPQLANQWDFTKNKLTPFDYLPTASAKVWWKCSKGHSWEAGINNRAYGRDCPYCSNQCIGDDNSLAFKFPDLIKQEWNFEKNTIDPNTVAPQCNKKAWWKCIKNHEWLAFIYSRTGKNRHGCPYCSNQKVCDDNSVLVTYPELLKYWDPNNTISLNEVLPTSSVVIMKWICPINTSHTWEESVKSRIKAKAACYYCTGERASIGYNFAKEYPELLKEWDLENNVLNPYEILPKSNEVVNWKCINNSDHVWSASITNRVRSPKKLGCPSCFSGVNTLEESFLRLFRDIFPNIEKFDDIAIEDTKYRPDFRLENDGKIVYINTDGLYWHSNNFRDYKYHLALGRCFVNNKKILLQFYEDEIYEQSKIVKSIILNKLGMISNKVHTRQCKLRIVEASEASKFFIDNHLMGNYKSAKTLGLYFKEELVSAMSYRIEKVSNKIEISRFANKVNTIVHHSFSRFLKHIKMIAKENGIFTISSFCDLRYANGVSYEKSGFIRVTEDRGFYWTDFYKRYNRRQCIAGNGKTEAENAAEKGWVKIYDAGQAKYVLNLKKEEIETEEESLKRMDVDYDPWIEAPLTEQEKEAFNKDYKEEDEL